MGGGSDYSGKFKLIRMDIGISYLIVFGKNNGMTFGPGVFGGIRAYSSGDIWSSSWLASSGSKIPERASVNEVLNPFCMGICLDLHKQFKVSNNRAFVFGIKESIQSTDGFHTKRLLVFNVMIGYKFFNYKKKQDYQGNK